jgi:hypothetical protein
MVVTEESWMIFPIYPCTTLSRQRGSNCAAPHKSRTSVIARSIPLCAFAVPAIWFGSVSPALAGACRYGETVTAVIMQGDTIYLSTDKSCPSWCSIGSVWSVTARACAFAMLVAAKTTDQTMAFSWADQPSSCSSVEVSPSSPTTISMM